MSKIKMYLSARISEDAHAWNNEICAHLEKHFDIFKPQDHNPYNLDHRQFQREVYEIDLRAMIESEIGILLAPYGRDCAWEVGWYSRSDKPIVMYVEKDTDWTRDWMIKGGIDAVFVANNRMYHLLNQDPIVSDKVIKVESKQKLSEAITRFLRTYQAEDRRLHA